MGAAVHPVEASQDGVDRWGNGVVGAWGHRCGHNREGHAMLARCRVALGRVASMGTTDCGIGKPSLFDYYKPPDNCFEGAISVPNCTTRGKLMIARSLMECRAL